MTEVKDTVPAWRIVPPAPADALLAHYREAEAATGVPWNFLAAIHLIETRFGSIEGTSTAGAQGPMQFLPATFEAYGDGGDIHSLRDSIMAAGRYLAANDFANNRDNAIFRYNNSDRYVRAVNDYATVLAADPAPSPATTGGTCTTARPRATYCCRSDTRRRHRSRSGRIWPTIRSSTA